MIGTLSSRPRNPTNYTRLPEVLNFLSDQQSMTKAAIFLLKLQSQKMFSIV